VAGAVVLGVGAVAFLHLRLDLPLLVSQLIGVVVTAAICFGVAAAVLRRKWGRNGDGEFLTARIAHGVAPYFLYGSFYHLFLFADRFLAWTAGTGASSLPFQFRGDYETALDIAMIAFVAEAGWVHMSMLAFYRRLNASQSRLDVGESNLFNRELRRFYCLRMGVFLPSAGVVGYLTYFTALRFGLLPTPQMREVASVALAAYPLLVLGLWNAGLFFALSRPYSALVAVIVGLGVNLSTGYLLSRVGSYQDAVYGFAAGSVVFAAVTTIQFIRLCRSVDHNHFASAA